MQTPHLSVTIHFFEIKIGHLWDLLRSNEKVFIWEGGGGYYKGTCDLTRVNNERVVPIFCSSAEHKRYFEECE